MGESKNGEGPQRSRRRWQPWKRPPERFVMAPWIARFARAAFQQRRHTEYLAPLVRCAADTLESQLTEVGRRDLLRRHGHYALWIGPKASKRAAAEQSRAAALVIPTKEASAELLRAAAAQLGWA